MEIIIIFFTVFGGLIAFITYYKNYVAVPQEIKTFSISKIESARKFNNELLEELQKYVDENNASKEHFMQGFSFAESIAMLETYKEKAFTTENIRMLNKLSGSSKNLEELTKKADEHILLVIQCKNYFHKFILKEDWHYE
ncbi:MAG: hypothetical protein WC209_01215 [Ignavibacteriaceae bacterium]|jgi:hypothetical protein